MYTKKVVFRNEVFFPEKTPEGYAIAYANVLSSNSENYDMLLTLNFSVLLSQLFSIKNGPCNGFVLILDGEKWGFGHTTKISLLVLKKFLFLIQVLFLNLVYVPYDWKKTF